jgi:hypothetical protein
MKTFGNIFLIWRKGPGTRRIPVGVIKHNKTEGVRFEYLKSNLNMAFENGFVSYTGFPDVDKTYNENVLEIFSQRLAKSERNDLNKFYEFWEVDPTKKEDNLYMLAKTQGLIPIDNFEFLANFYPKKGLVFVSEIAGLGKTKIESGLISNGDTLSFEKEIDNPYDKFAVKLFKDDLFLGYVKLKHSAIFYNTDRKFEIKIHHLEKNGVIKRAFIRIKVM